MLTPQVIWLTGLSGSGKSTIARCLESRLRSEGHIPLVLDGDIIRRGLSKDLGYSVSERVENIRRVAEIAKLAKNVGIPVIVSLISPFKRERYLAREIIGHFQFFEIFVDTPLDECIRRDPKGLYSKALAGEIKNFTGLSSPYERPDQPEMRIQTIGFSPEYLTDSILKKLQQCDHNNL